MSGVILVSGGARKGWTDFGKSAFSGRNGPMRSTCCRGRLAVKYPKSFQCCISRVVNGPWTTPCGSRYLQHFWCKSSSGRAGGGDFTDGACGTTHAGMAPGVPPLGNEALFRDAGEPKPPDELAAGDRESLWLPSSNKVNVGGSSDHSSPLCCGTVSAGEAGDSISCNCGSGCGCNCNASCPQMGAGGGAQDGGGGLLGGKQSRSADMGSREASTEIPLISVAIVPRASVSGFDAIDLPKKPPLSTKDLNSVSSSSSSKKNEKSSIRGGCISGVKGIRLGESGVLTRPRTCMLSEDFRSLDQPPSSSSSSSRTEARFRLLLPLSRFSR